MMRPTVVPCTASSSGHRSLASAMAAIYVYPLEPAWRDRLGLPEPLRRPAPAIGEGLEGDAWAAHEFGGALLGDRRLSQRLVDSVLIQMRAALDSLREGSERFHVKPV
ncbi:MAG TPA: hypothetical protein DCY47_11295 [Candidatus Accumulibacter sp.]|nr:hypothetical protein [Accumulibacter sp.]